MQYLYQKKYFLEGAIIQKYPKRKVYQGNYICVISGF